MTIPLSEPSPTPWRFLGAFYCFLRFFQAHPKGVQLVSRTVVGGILKVLDIFEILLPPALRPKIFPRSASVNSEPFGIVKENKPRKIKIRETT